MDYLVLGTYATHRQVHVGTGTTAHSQEQSIMWLAAQLPTNDISIQPLDPNHIPTGIVTTIRDAEFFQKYAPEPDCYEQHLRAGIKKLSVWLGAVSTPMPKEKPDHETGRFLRGCLSILHGEAGMSIRPGDPDILRLLVQQAAEMHFYDHFRIGLALAAVRQRKERNYPLAINFYSRALEVREDDHLLFNLARTYYEMKNIDAAKTCLEKALELNPELTVARQFLDFIAVPQQRDAGAN